MSGRMASYIPGGGADHAAEAKRAAAWAERAKRDAMKHIAKDIPGPKQFAYCLSGDEVEALQTAHRQYGVWHVAGRVAAILKPSGICEAGKGRTALTNFGIAVMTALREDHDA